MARVMTSAATRLHDAENRGKQMKNKIALEEHFAIEPTLDKLAALDAIVKANPTSDHINDWITRMGAMITVYQQAGSSHSQTPAPAAGTPTPAPPPSP